MKLRFLLLTLVCLALLAAVAVPALAHGELLRSVPEANAMLDRSPAQVELFFSEPLEPSFSRISVFNANGVQVDVGDSRVDANDPTRLRVSIRSLPDGVYTVSWQVLSNVDGHVTSGAFPFAVGQVDAAALAAEQASRTVKLLPGEVVARWLSYLALAILTGGLFFVLLVWQPVYQAVQTETNITLSGWTPWQHLARIALLLLLPAQVLGLFVQAGQISGVEMAAPWNPAAGQILFATRYGTLWIGRLALALTLVGLWPANRARRWFAIGVALLLPLTLSLGSHAAAEPQPILPVLADWLHLLAASVWVGGLIYFVAGLWTIREFEPVMRTRLTARLIPRFSALALLSVGTLALSGVYATSLRIGALEHLTGTWYGRSLLIKLFIFLPMVMLGAINLFNTSPAMKRAAQAGNAALITRFHRLISSEVTLGAAVLLSVGVLTALPPPQVAASAPTFDLSAEVDDLSLKLNITPGRVGVNTFTTYVTAGRQPVVNAKEVALRFTPKTTNVPPSEAQLIGQGNGQYTIKGSYLSLPDTWQVQVVVRREGQFDSFANFDLDLTAAASQTYSWPRLNAVLLLLVGLAYAFTVRKLSQTRSQWVAWGMTPALALALIGLAIFYRPPATTAADPVNPIPPNAASVSAGQALYERNCVSCHGPTGQGDGPVGLTLNPRPADLTQHTAPGVHPDGQLYEWISAGFPGSVMPAFKANLTEEDRWHLVNYIRTLAPSSR